MSKKHNYLAEDTEKKYPIKRGWVVYNQNHDKFMVMDRDANVKWDDDIAWHERKRLTKIPEWVPVFAHTQKTAFNIFFKGYNRKLKYPKFDPEMYRGVVLVSAEGNESLKYVASTNFGWVVPMCRFDRRYTMMYGTPEIEKWL